MRISIFLIAASLFFACDKPQDKVTSTKVVDKRGEQVPVKSKTTKKSAANDSMAAERPASFADIVEATRPAVVNIYTRKKVKTNRLRLTENRKLVPDERVSESLGSGFILDADGHVLTNYHVIQKATDIEVRLFDERRFKATVVGIDPKTDVALLKLEKAKMLPVVKLGDSEKLRVGDWVVAIGNPLGLTSTVTAGIASATGRRSLPMSGDLLYQDFIQTDASINPGNSGGPLFDTDGKVVGINTAINAQGQGLGFAIPINMVKDLMPRLKQGGKVKRGWLGINIASVPPVLAQQLKLPTGGVLVTKIVRGGPGHRAKLKKGDVVLSIDGKPVSKKDQLVWAAGNIEVGREVPIKIQRGTEPFDLTIKIGQLPD